MQSDDDQERNEQSRRMWANLAVIVIVCAIVGGGTWLFNRIDAAKKSQECLGSGSIRCRILDNR